MKRAGQGDQRVIGVKDIDLPIVKIGRVNEIAPAADARRKSREIRVGTGEVHLEHGGAAGIPGGDGAVLGGEDEMGRGGARRLKARHGVSDDSGRTRGAGFSRGNRDGDDEGLLDPGAGINGGESRDIVLKPEWAGRAGCNSPRIDEVCVRDQCQSRNVGDKIALDIGILSHCRFRT